MSMIEEQVAAAKPAFQESLIHIECCIQKRGEVGFCGTPLHGRTYKDTPENCVVCSDIDLGPHTCPYDGEPCPGA